MSELAALHNLSVTLSGATPLYTEVLEVHFFVAPARREYGIVGSIVSIEKVVKNERCGVDEPHRETK